MVTPTWMTFESACRIAKANNDGDDEWTYAVKHLSGVRRDGWVVAVFDVDGSLLGYL